MNYMEELISRKALLETIDYKYDLNYGEILIDPCEFASMVEDAPIVEAVSRGLFDQIKFERDVAIAQLEELGLSLGQKIDGVYLTKEEHDKLFDYKYMYEDLCE